MFHSGEWDGHWTQGRLRGRMHPLVLVFTPDGTVEGRGEDMVGKFTFKGTFTELGEVEMRKQYHHAHGVAYEGRADGKGGIIGRWDIGGFTSGNFVLEPVVCEPPAETAPPTAVTPVEPDRPSPLRRRRRPPPATP